jgi:hypothetical protein
MKQAQNHVLDLTEINGSGDFLCPECGAAISPDDCNEEAYSILDIKVNNQGLEELVIRCNKCASHLHLTGFSLLQKLHDTNETRTLKQPFPTFLASRNIFFLLTR